MKKFIVKSILIASTSTILVGCGTTATNNESSTAQTNYLPEGKKYLTVEYETIVTEYGKDNKHKTITDYSTNPPISTDYMNDPIDDEYTYRDQTFALPWVLANQQKFSENNGEYTQISHSYNDMVDTITGKQVTIPQEDGINLKQETDFGVSSKDGSKGEFFPKQRTTYQQGEFGVTRTDIDVFAGDDGDDPYKVISHSVLENKYDTRGNILETSLKKDDDLLGEMKATYNDNNQMLTWRYDLGVLIDADASTEIFTFSRFGYKDFMKFIKHDEKWCTVEYQYDERGNIIVSTYTDIDTIRIEKTKYNIDNKKIANKVITNGEVSEYYNYEYLDETNTDNKSVVEQLLSQYGKTTYIKHVYINSNGEEETTITTSEYDEHDNIILEKTEEMVNEVTVRTQINKSKYELLEVPRRDPVKYYKLKNYNGLQFTARAPFFNLFY